MFVNISVPTFELSPCLFWINLSIIHLILWRS